MKLALLPAVALGALVVYCLLKLWLSGSTGEMEGVVTLVGSYAVYFYLIFGTCALIGVAVEKRLTYSYGGPFALVALLLVLGLFTGGSGGGGWISLKIGPVDFMAVPGMLIWSTVAGSGASVVERTPVAAMASRNIAIEFVGAVPRANGDLVAALRCEAPQPWNFSRVVRLSAAGEPVEEIAFLPYLYLADPRPDGTLRLVWQGQGHHQAGTIDANNKLQRDPSPVPDEDVVVEKLPPLTARRPDGATYSILPGDDTNPDRIVLLDSPGRPHPGFEIRTDPEADRIETIHVEPDSGLLVMFEVLGIHRYFYRRENVWPRVERFRQDGTPDKPFNEGVRSIGQGMDAVKLMARLPSGDLVFAAQRIKGRAQLYYVSPSGSIRSRRDF